ATISGKPIGKGARTSSRCTSIAFAASQQAELGGRQRDLGSTPRVTRRVARSSVNGPLACPLPRTNGRQQVKGLTDQNGCPHRLADGTTAANFRRCRRGSRQPPSALNDCKIVTKNMLLILIKIR